MRIMLMGSTLQLGSALLHAQRSEDAVAPAQIKITYAAFRGTLWLCFWPVYGLDFSPDALGYCRQRGEKMLVRGSIADLPFPAQTFDLITTLDVLD